MRLQLVDSDARSPWSGPTLFDACLDVDLTPYYDQPRGDSGTASALRDAVVDALSDVLKTAAEIFDSIAHGERLTSTLKFTAEA